MTNEGKPYMTIDEACAVTGLSRHYLRAGCKAGNIPHIMVGCKYMVYVPGLLAQLAEQAKRNAGASGEVGING